MSKYVYQPRGVKPSIFETTYTETFPYFGVAMIILMIVIFAAIFWFGYLKPIRDAEKIIPKLEEEVERLKQETEKTFNDLKLVTSYMERKEIISDAFKEKRKVSDKFYAAQSSGGRNFINKDVIYSAILISILTKKDK